ncbi:MAG: O-antigen ligase family protein [Chloroflexi bacterium]|nr:O-antigen ligase family protein [Chloroflexota bacterium]
MTTPTAGSTISTTRRWLGLADPVPDRGRLAAAAIAALLMLVLTIVGADVPKLGAGGGRLFAVFAVVVGPLVAWLLVLRPWTGVLAWAATMALLNAPRIQWWFGPVQVIGSTVFVGALLAGTWFVWVDRTGSTVGDVRGRWVTAARRSRAGILAIALMVVVVLSLMASPTPGPGIPIILHGAVEPILSAFLVSTLRPSRRQILWLGGAIVVGLGLASLYSILRIGRVATTVDGLEAVRVQLAHFTFYNVGLYGIALAMAIPLAAAGLLSWKAIGLRRSGAIALLGLLAILGLGLYLTFSKSAWLATAFAILLVIAGRFRRRRELGALIVASAIGLSLIIPYPLLLLRAVSVDLPATNPYVELLTKVQGGRLLSWDVGSPEGEVSIGERWKATLAAGRMVIDHPLLGVGPGRFGAEYAGRYADPGATRALGAPHDLLPEVASELGLPAALLLLVALFGAARSAWRAARARAADLRVLGAGYGAALAGFIVVTATFGLDLYREYRVMNSDVILAALVVGACVALGHGLDGSRDLETEPATR